MPITNLYGTLSAMAMRLWEYRKKTGENSGQMAWTQDSGCLQIMCLSSSGELFLHIIEEGVSHADPWSYLEKDLELSGHRMQIREPFTLLPELFYKTRIAGNSEASDTTKLGEGIVLSTPHTENPAFHAALPLYLAAREKAGNHAAFEWIWVHEGICFVLLFKNGNCILANSYPVANDSEVLYFALAVAKKSDLDVRRVHFEILADDPAALLRMFGRFVSSVSPAQLELPYAAGEYPPHAPVSFLLYHFLTCELPVAG